MAEHATPLIRQHPLPYVDGLERRPSESVDLLVIHCTELPDLALARDYGERIVYEGSGTGNSGHYYIDRDGRIVQYVPVNRVAHHVAGYNERSIGIELVNRGRYPRWHHSDSQTMSEPYTRAQLDALQRLVEHLKDQLPGLRRIAGHEDLDRRMIPAEDDPEVQIRRKMDPGPLFPWEQVLETSSLERLQPDG